MSKIATFKMRASAASKLLVKPRRKKDTMSKTLQSYCKEWALNQVLNRKPKQVKSKYLKKGNEAEQSGIDLLNSVMQTSYVKNKKKYEDDWFIGTPDIAVTDLVIDIKNSYDHTTFQFFESEISPEHAAQLHVYMHLTGARKAYIANTLCDMPTDLITDEVYSYARFARIEVTDELIEEFTDYYTYSFDIPPKLRLKTFELEYNPEVIEHMKIAVEGAREYIYNLIKNCNNGNV